MQKAVQKVVQNVVQKTFNLSDLIGGQKNIEQPYYCQYPEYLFGTISE